MRLRWWFLITGLLAVICFPPQWYPDSLRLQLARWLGASSYAPPPASKSPGERGVETACPEDPAGYAMGEPLLLRKHQRSGFGFPRRSRLD